MTYHSTNSYGHCFVQNSRRDFRKANSADFQFNEKGILEHSYLNINSVESCEREIKMASSTCNPDADTYLDLVLSNIVKVLNSLVLLVFLIVSAFVGAAPALAENAAISSSNKLIKLQKNGVEVVPYAQVNKLGNYSRKMYLDSASAVVFEQTGKLPSSALFLMDTLFEGSNSTVFIREKTQSGFVSGYINPNGNARNASLSRMESCDGCHSRAAALDNTFTLELLRKALLEKQIQTIFCDEQINRPCRIGTYRGD